VRRLIVCNFVTVDGYYESKDKTIDDLFEHYHSAYADDQSFDHYTTERLRAADTLVLSGRTSFLGNKSYWTSVPGDPRATAIRREFASLIERVDKVVVSDQVTQDDLAPWTNTRIVRVADAPREIAALKRQPRRDVLILLGRVLWNGLSEHGLVDELHLVTFPIVAGDGIKLFDGRPPEAPAPCTFAICHSRRPRTRVSSMARTSEATIPAPLLGRLEMGEASSATGRSALPAEALILAARGSSGVIERRGRPPRSDWSSSESR
jgi:dihydrofolate reductase